jgi:hypothetical protein
MIKIRKTFQVHARELVAVILLQLAAKIAPKQMKPKVELARRRAANVARVNNIYRVENNEETTRPHRLSK